MAEFRSFAPNVEVRGEVMAAFIGGFPAGTQEIGLECLQKSQISGVRPGEWYPLQSFLDAMKEIRDRFGVSFLSRVGEQIAMNAVLPPGLDSLEQCLSSIDVAYHMNHRGGEIGHYQYTYKGIERRLHRAVMSCANPYPCSFDLGVIQGFSNRFKPATAIDVVVLHDDSGPCRRRGEESCIYTISWT
jgi:hypothetical protein